MNHTVKSLIYVVTESTHAVREYAAELSSTPSGDRSIPAILKMITAEADVLSSALAKLSNFVDELPDPKESKMRSEPNAERARLFLKYIRKVNLITTNGLCDDCGGIRS